MRAHVKLTLGGLGASFQLTPGEVRHPLLVSIENAAPAPASSGGADGPLDGEAAVDDEVALLDDLDVVAVGHVRVETRR